MRRRLPILVLTCLTLPLSARGGDSPARGGAGDRERALEERVAELERLVGELLAEREAAARAEDVREVREEVREVREKVVELDEEKAIRVTGGRNSSFRFGGFVKHDMMLSRYSAGLAPPRGLIRDFHVPALIPVGGEASTTDFDTHMRETRFFFDTRADTPAGATLQAYLEFDFSAATGGDERLTNSTSPNIRHAFVRYNNKVLAGQSWTTFFNVGALPENLDFIGPVEGTIFVRQSQVRFTSGPWEFALENPETTVIPYGGGALTVTDTANIPDLVARYNHSADWGHFTVAGLGRRLAIGKTGPGGVDRETAYALSASGRFNLGRNDLRWMASGGRGIGRYLGLNAAADAALDAGGALRAISAYGGFVGYRHFWSGRWRSNFTLSGFYADNPIDVTGVGVTRTARSAHANLIYQFAESLFSGVEYQFARRGIEAGDKGNMNRLQFSTVMTF